MSVEVLREAARGFVERTSLRVAAGEIGISHSGLRTFLKGTEPYGPTLAKLRVWYATTDAGRVAQARAALVVLLDHLPSKEREAARRKLVEFVRQESKAAGVAVPDWVEELGGR